VQKGSAVKCVYDSWYNVGYIRFCEKRAEVESLRISDKLVVDVAPDGTVYEIGLLNAAEQLQRQDLGELIVINEATGEHTKLPLLKTETG
jgi:uncharacterized protein YuzE